MRLILLSFSLFFLISNIQSQNASDDFEGNGNINTWYGDDCAMDNNFSNPYQQGENTSPTVLRYHDTGGQYANVRFDAGSNFDLLEKNTFSLKIYVPSNGITGTAPNQISLKLQNNTLAEPWLTQTEIIKPISLDTWQTITFDFEHDPYINLDGGSPAPLQRNDLNRVVIQINGENNNDHVLAFLDDIDHFESEPEPSIFTELVWADEFDTDGAIDDGKWFPQTQLPDGGSWFNGEIQHYTDREENATVEDGLLKIIARKENYTDQGVTKSHTSARLNSKFAFQYGRVEIRAKLPTGVGTWPAMWMLGKNIIETGAYWTNEGFGTTYWPACGEIDIMEHWGNNQNYVQSATHTPSSFGATVNHGGQYIPTVSSDFHIYALEWTADKLVFSVDDVIHYTYEPEVQNADTWPFDAEQYILLNIAIQPEIDASFTQSAMEIDYVRVYQEPTSSIAQWESEELTTFPNPVEEYLVIQLEASNNANIPISIHDMNGKLVRQIQATPFQQQITIENLGHLPTGTYNISFEYEHRHFHSQFIKK